MANWYDDGLQLRDFADALVEAEHVNDSADVLAKPYKFTSEFLRWKANDYPDPIDDDTSDENDINWNNFVNEINEEETEEESEEPEEGEAE